jgi:energy-coupling factor transport system permease protein
MKRVLDPRTKLLLLILAALYIGLQLPFTIEIILILIYVSPLFFADLYRAGFTFIGIYILQLFASIYIVPRVSIGFLIFVVSFLTHGLRMLLPSIIAGYYAMKTTKVNEWIAAFKKLRLPNWLLIPLAVMARFFPTIREDYRHIRKAMAFRGIGTSFWDLVKNPVQTLEFILIPLLMNATQVSEDLTVSALTKGLSLPGRHTTIVHLSLTKVDWLYMALALLPFALYLGGVM